MSMRRTSIVLLALTAVLAVSCGQAGPARPQPPAAHARLAASAKVAAAHAVAPDPRVGAVFLGGNSLHTCSGAVLDSAAGNLILTAAHCMADGYDTFFVPGFKESAEPQDFWRVNAVYLDPRWMKNRDPMADFAVARVSRDGGGSLEKHAGGGYTLGDAPKAGTDVMVTGYAFGEGGDPIACDARTSGDTSGFPSLRCKGMVDGTSGSPWVADSVISGIVGGLEGGGCQEDMSYSPPFDGALSELLRRAEAGGTADAAPNDFDPKC
jgi:Trypsin-like peptidase domain